MSYFLPSYFQKRLLRYALSRLDLIETDDLDLENLGLTFGQRSVVELKNVSIKVDKLTRRANLPTSVVVETASIRLLRLTIPADLHVSGIVVEVEGVEIKVTVRDLQEDIPVPESERRRRPTPSYTNKADRPRLASPSVHDPGGPKRIDQDPHHVDISRVIPTSQDLAASFLEAEPIAERQGLEATIGSQSRYLHESIPQSENGGEDGLGLPGGLALPSFVAGFFQGVADRLSLIIKSIKIGVLIEPVSGLKGAESISFNLGVDSVEVDSATIVRGDGISGQPSRHITLNGINFGIDANSLALSRTTSPVLGRPHSKISDTPSQQLRSSSSEAASNNSIHFRPSIGLGLEQSLADSTKSLAGSHHDYVDNKANAEQSANASFSSRSTDEDSLLAQDEEPLSESRLFSHNEAESMYMSAMSNDNDEEDNSRPIPGAWDLGESVTRASTKTDPMHTVEPTKEEERAALGEQGPAGVSADAAMSSGPKTVSEAKVETAQEATTPEPAFVSILGIDSLILELPDSGTSQKEASAAASYNADTANQSGYGERVVQTPHNRQVVSNASFKMKVTQMGIDIDLPTCVLLARMSQDLTKVLGLDADPRKAQATAEETRVLKPSVELQQIHLNFHESLMGRTSSLAPRESLRDTADDESLLSLSLANVKFLNEGVKGRTLTISQIVLRHGSKHVMWFVDAVNVRDSIVGSTMLRPHDFYLNKVDERLEAHIKPVHVVLDLVVIDDVLSRSGGLSSLLDLGNSMTSTSTVKAPKSRPPKIAPQARTVRFDDSHQRVRSASDPSSSGSKINLRLGGSIIDLVGSAASVQVKSTAIKIAHRDGAARIVIDGAAIEGPLLPNSTSPAGVVLKAKGLEIRYSDKPDELDLDRLLSLITPSNDKYDKDDDIMVDTLLRQRRKGAVLRINLAEGHVAARGFEWRQYLESLADELAKLSSVTKYLPEDDRPGILIFTLINKFDARLQVDDTFGPLSLKSELVEAAHINVPSLIAAQVSTWSLLRTSKDVLIGEVLSQGDAAMGAPMLMCRFISGEMEPTVRLKFSNTCVEYSVRSLSAITNLAERLNTHIDKTDSPAKRQLSPSSSNSSDAGLSRKIRLSIIFRDSAIGLHPNESLAKGLFVLSDAVLAYNTGKRASNITLDLKKGSLLLINTTETLASSSGNVDQKVYFDQTTQIQQLTNVGFVPVGTMSAASAIIKISEDDISGEQHVDVDFKNDLLFLETCADSTQTLFQIVGGLAPPPAPSKVAKYRTEILPIEDMLASFTGNAFVTEPGPELGLDASRMTQSTVNESDPGYEEEEEDDGYGGFMNDLNMDDSEAEDEMTESYAETGMEQSTASSLHIAPVDVSALEAEDLAESMVAHSMLDFRTDHFAAKTDVGGTAHRWDSKKNTYGLGSENTFSRSPLKIRIRDVHILWNLFDGYDWQTTRDTITQAVKDIESRAMMKRPRSITRSPGPEDDAESVIGDTLFNSIYISIPANHDPRGLASAINHDIDDLVSETGSYATGTTVTATPSGRQSYQPRPKRLKLNRSKQHKMSFELAGVSADFVAFPPSSGEVESSIDVRVKKLEIFDNLPTSTWKKFATYMSEAGEQQINTNMVHLELLNVKPVAELSASEMVLKLTILPLRLHVDQDAVDFLSRFFEFKDDSAPASESPSPPPFLQRVEVNPVQLKLDYKPKKVDYAGLRSGRTTEFMNFIILDRADILLRRVILYGVSGFDRMGIMLNNIWSPDVRSNQLPRVLAGLAPIRPLVDVAGGVRELVAVPMREYRKDGRVVRSIQKGAVAFAKTTATELVNLGAKLAIGTQQILQNTEEMLVTPDDTHTDTDEEGRRAKSLYADQPVGIVQGLRGAYASLERDLLLARDAIIAVPGEVMASDSARGAAQAVLKQSPTIILRPAIGATKAIGQTLLGAGNTLDRGNLRRMEDVSAHLVCLVASC